MVPTDQNFTDDYTGMFRFRFWHFGRWVEVVSTKTRTSDFINFSKSQVVIDDFIPVKNNEPVFVHSTNSGEMWPCLLEKAYSKLQGEAENPSKSQMFPQDPTVT